MLCAARRLLCGAVLLAVAPRGGWASGDGRENAAVLSEQAACPLEALAAMHGRQISPRVPGAAAEGSAAEGSYDVPARPESFRGHSSIIQRLPNGMIRKILPGKPGETVAESKRRVLKEAEYMGKFYLYRNFPRVVTVDVEERAIYMEDCGRPLTRQNVPCDWRRQLAAMLHVLQEHAVFHNDWLGLGWPDTPNLTERDGILYLIDFTWATTGKDSYPFMNPSEDLIARATTMWDMFELTRGLHEHRRLRFQHALDRQSIKRRELASRQGLAHLQARARGALAGGATATAASAAAEEEEEQAFRDDPNISVVRVLEKVGHQVKAEPLHGATLSAGNSAVLHTARTHAHAHTRTHAHTHTRTHAHTHTHTRTHAHTHTRISPAHCDAVRAPALLSSPLLSSTLWHTPTERR